MSEHARKPIPVAPSLGVRRPSRGAIDSRIVLLCGVSMAIAAVAAVVAQLLVRLIGLVTNLSFHHRLSTEFASPGSAPDWGPWVIALPVIGGIIVGLMARYGSRAIRGHGIPEAMEQVLLNESRIPARVTLLKPLSAAVSIGTGGPFGAEGPIIATGGAMGSLLGQFMRTTPQERKTLLAAGAAAGMTATFGSPFSAVLLAVELLLFEFRARSLVPVALAATVAAGVRLTIEGKAPAFPMPELANVPGSAIAAYVAIGAVVGVAAVAVTRLVYWIEDLFEELPIHWMWWPAIGGFAVGVVGYFFPRTLGVGYDNITSVLSGSVAWQAIAILAAMKFVSWSISLGSGTSGGTLAPLLTIGGGLGAVLGIAGQALLPSQGIDPRVAALVGMAAMFAGASRALLTSVVFAYETTQQPLGLLPLLGGCSASYLVSALLMPSTIMTEKIIRRGVRVPTDYAPDFLDLVSVRDFATREPRTVPAEWSIDEARTRILSSESGWTHQGFPVIDARGDLVGVVTRRELLAAPASASASASGRRVGDLVSRPAVTVEEGASLRDAADLMTHERIGRLPVIRAGEPRRIVGILTRSDVLGAHARRLREGSEARRHIELKRKRSGPPFG